MAEASRSTVMRDPVKRSRADNSECDVRDKGNCVVLGQASGVPRNIVSRRRWSCKAFRTFLSLNSEEGSLAVSPLAYESPEPLYMGADESHRHLLYSNEDSGTYWE